MKPRHAVLLVLTSAFALGCASANAQDGQGNPKPPQEQPGGAARRPAPADFESPEAVRRRMHMAELDEQVRAAEARLTDAKARLDQLVKVEKKGADEASVREATTQVERAATELEIVRTRAQLAHPDPRRRGGFGGRVDEPRDGGHREFRSRRAGSEGRGGRPEGGPGRGGPGPSVEQRLEMLERAVHEMHAMFERHHVGQEMRERAEHEMRARALGGPDTRPMQPGGPMGPQVPPPGSSPTGPAVPPRPPMARPGAEDGAGGGQLEQHVRELREELLLQGQEARKQIEAARQRAEELSRQLADTQAALKKAQEELETLRAKK